jgi:hypothetical protein
VEVVEMVNVHQLIMEEQYIKHVVFVMVLELELLLERRRVQSVAEVVILELKPKEKSALNVPMAM